MTDDRDQRRLRHSFWCTWLRRLALRLLQLERSPNIVCRLADALVHHEFACQRGQHVRAVIHRLQTAVGEFTLNRHRDQKFPSHEPKTSSHTLPMFQALHESTIPISPTLVIL